MRLNTLKPRKDKTGIVLRDCVCVFPIDEQGTPCGAHFMGYYNSKYCPQHKAAGHRMSTDRSVRRRKAEKAGVRESHDLYYRVKDCPVCQKPLLPTRDRPDVCHCADYPKSVDRLTFEIALEYNPATKQRIAVTRVKKHAARGAITVHG